MQSEILVLGSVNVDMVIRSQVLPKTGETVLGGEFYQAGGGKGANQAVAAGRVSVSPVSLAAAVGDDLLGQEAVARFAQENLCCRYVRQISGESTGVALILVDGDGNNVISVASGANARLITEDVDRIRGEDWKSYKVLLTCLESPISTVKYVLRRARREGMLTILNPAPAFQEITRQEVLSLVDVLTPNEREAAELTGIDPGTQTGLERAGRKLQEQGAASVIITRGARGSVLIGKSIEYFKGCVVEAVDSTGAGDAFNGVLAVALSEGRSLSDAVEWANHAAACAVKRRGAQPSFPDRSEVENQMKIS